MGSLGSHLPPANAICPVWRRKVSARRVIKICHAPVWSGAMPMSTAAGVCCGDWIAALRVCKGETTSTRSQNRKKSPKFSVLNIMIVDLRLPENKPYGHRNGNAIRGDNAVMLFQFRDNIVFRQLFLMIKSPIWSATNSSRAIPHRATQTQSTQLSPSRGQKP